MGHLKGIPAIDKLLSDKVKARTKESLGEYINRLRDEGKVDGDGAWLSQDSPATNFWMEMENPMHVWTDKGFHLFKTGDRTCQLWLLPKASLPVADRPFKPEAPWCLVGEVKIDDELP